MAKQGNIGMGERTYAKIKDLLLSMKDLRKEMGLVEDSNGQLRTATGKLVQGLDAAKIQMNVWVDEQGRARDGLGRLVDGLSNVQIAMRQYIDQNGQLRNSQGQIIDGLNAAQKAAGMYKNELGDLCNAQGEVVRQSAQSAAALRDETKRLAQEKRDAVRKEIEDAREAARIVREQEQEKVNAARAARAEMHAQDAAAGRLRQSMVSSAGAIAMVTSNLMRMNGQSDGTARLVLAVTTGVTAFKAATSATKLLTAAKDILRGKTLAQFVAQMSLNGATGNFAALAAGAAAACLAGGLVLSMTQTGDAAQTAAGKVDGLGESVKRLQELADKNHKPLFDVEEIGQVMKDAAKSQADQMLTAVQEMKKFETERALALRAIKGAQDLQQEIGKKKSEELVQSIKDKFFNQFQGFDPTQFERMFQQIVTAKLTPLEKMQKSLEVVDATIRAGLDQTGTAAKAREILRQDIIKESNRLILEANRDAETALKAARDSLASFPDALTKLQEGIVQLGDLKDAVTGKWLYSDAELAKAQADAAKQLREKFLGGDLSALNDAIETSKTAWEKENELRKEYDEKWLAFKKHLDQGIITQEEFNAAQNGLKKKLKENAEKIRGTDWTAFQEALDSAKTALEKESDLRKEYVERLDAFRNYLQRGLVTQEQFNTAQEALSKKLRENVEKLHETEWTKTFTELAELRKPIQETIRERFRQIAEEGARLKATSTEIEKIQMQELEKIKAKYGIKDQKEQLKQQQTKQEQQKKQEEASPVSALAGSVEAYKIALQDSSKTQNSAARQMAGAQTDATKRIQKIAPESEITAARTLAKAQMDAAKRLQVETPQTAKLLQETINRALGRETAGKEVVGNKEPSDHVKLVADNVSRGFTAVQAGQTQIIATIRQMHIGIESQLGKLYQSVNSIQQPKVV